MLSELVLQHIYQNGAQTQQKRRESRGRQRAPSVLVRTLHGVEFHF
jgi:hypothetical protein